MKTLAPARALPARFDPFRSLSRDARCVHLERYRSHLEARDGALDLDGRRLPARERFFERLACAPVAWRGPLDREGFRRRFQGLDTQPIDARTLWLVAVAKANQSERYGVELLLSKLLAPGAPPPDPVKAYLFIEEHYHTRLLVEACRTCGVDLQLLDPPPATRFLIHTIYYLPDRLRWPLVLCGEVLGTTVFKLLLDACPLFAAEPAVEARLRELVSEIWRDEVLHVAYLRARLGRVGLAVARALLPAVARHFMHDVPQLSELGCDARELLRRLRAGVELPPDLAWIEPEHATS